MNNHVNKWVLGKWHTPNKYGRIRKPCVVTGRRVFAETSKYKPHQGAQECARRVRQLAKGMIVQ